MKHCHFICKEIKINGSSKYFDGNLKLFYSLFLRILEFLQQHKIEYSTHQIVSDDLLENLKTPFYNFTDERKLQQAQPPIQSKTAVPLSGNVSIYSNIGKTVDLDNSEVIFLDLDDGLNLLKYYSTSNLSIEPDEFTQKNFIDKEKATIIVSDVI